MKQGCSVVQRNRRRVVTLRQRHGSRVSRRRTRARILHELTPYPARALIFAKPVLCVPFFGGHFDVAQRLHESGAGTWADKISLDPSEVRRTLLEMAAGKKALRVGSAPLSPSSASFSSSVSLPGSRAARRAAAAAREAIAVAAVRQLVTLRWN